VFRRESGEGDRVDESVFDLERWDTEN